MRFCLRIDDIAVAANVAECGCGSGDGSHAKTPKTHEKYSSGYSPASTSPARTVAGNVDSVLQFPAGSFGPEIAAPPADIVVEEASCQPERRGAELSAGASSGGDCACVAAGAEDMNSRVVSTCSAAI